MWSGFFENNDDCHDFDSENNTTHKYAIVVQYIHVERMKIVLILLFEIYLNQKKSTTNR